MTGLWRDSGDERREAAAAWVVRLEASGLDDADAIAFDAWLSQSPLNALAFDAALSVSHDYASAGDDIAKLLVDRPLPRNTPDRRGVLVGVGMAAAAAAAAVVVAPALLSNSEAQTFVTAKGERRSVRLADGSTVDLNAGTRLSVRLAGDGRYVALDQGQAVFDVAHDTRRPFLVAAGDRVVRVVGTQFDVRRRDGRLSVTVARGAVEVRPSDGSQGRAFRLHPGQRLDHLEGAAEVQIAAANPDEVLGWRAGRLIYRGQSLAEVVSDLNQQFVTPIRIEDPSLLNTPISGVLVLDDQASVIRRLALLVPISAVRSERGVILRRDAASERR